RHLTGLDRDHRRAGLRGPGVVPLRDQVAGIGLAERVAEEDLVAAGDEAADFVVPVDASPAEGSFLARVSASDREDIDADAGLAAERDGAGDPSGDRAGDEGSHS